jgi:hypothetical protein
MPITCIPRPKTFGRLKNAGNVGILEGVVVRSPEMMITALALLLTICLGLLSRLIPIGWYPYDMSLGDVLYAVALG